MTQHFAFVIPAFNEARSIAKVVTGVAAYGLPIVVDDGSNDATARLAAAAGADVVVHPRNLGYDAALESGLRRALQLDMTHALILDGDGQHVEAAVNACRDAFADANEEVDLVIGVRNEFQRTAEHIFAIVGRRRWGIADPLCGLKGYRLSRLAELGPFNTYPSIGTEAAIRLVQRGAVLRQVPITVAPRRGASRFGAGLRPNLIILRALLQGLLLRTD